MAEKRKIKLYSTSYQFIVDLQACVKYAQNFAQNAFMLRK